MPPIKPNQLFATAMGAVLSMGLGLQLGGGAAMIGIGGVGLVIWAFSHSDM
jgi:hypothetical protein